MSVLLYGAVVGQCCKNCNLRDAHRVQFRKDSIVGGTHLEQGQGMVMEEQQSEVIMV